MCVHEHGGTCAYGYRLNVSLHAGFEQPGKTQEWRGGKQCARGDRRHSYLRMAVSRTMCWCVCADRHPCKSMRRERLPGLGSVVGHIAKLSLRWTCSPRPSAPWMYSSRVCARWVSSRGRYALVFVSIPMLDRSGVDRERPRPTRLLWGVVRLLGIPTNASERVVAEAMSPAHTNDASDDVVDDDDQPLSASSVVLESEKVATRCARSARTPSRSVPSPRGHRSSRRR